MSNRHFRLTPAGALASVALFLALGGAAFAAGGGFVGGGGKIQGCIGKKGALSIVKAGKKCGKGTTALAFSQTGPTGPKGSTGNTGPSTGAAGGVLSGNYPNPGVNANVSAGCGSSTALSEAITQISNAGAVNCSDAIGTQFSARVNNVGAGDDEFGPASGAADGSGSFDSATSGSSSLGMTAVNMTVSAGVADVTVSLEYGPPTSSAVDTALSCQTAANGTCAVNGTTAIPGGDELAIEVNNQSGGSIAAVVGWWGATPPASS